MKRSGGRKKTADLKEKEREEVGRREIKNKKGAEGEEWGDKWEGKDASNLWA